MPRLGEVTRESRDVFQLAGCKWLSVAMNQTGLVRGGVYLLAGAPGAGKTTLALQIAVDLAAQRRKIVYVTFEQSVEDLKAIVENRIFEHMSSSKPTGFSRAKGFTEGLAEARALRESSEAFEVRRMQIEEHLYLEESVSSVEGLSDFLLKRVGFGDLKDTDLIVVDSLQGQGISGSSTSVFKKVYEFAAKTKAARIPLILTCHVTKAGQIAGPRSLEHNVDCVIYMRKAMRLRPLFVPKNRFGPERHEPHILVMNSKGVLEPSKHMASNAQLALGYHTASSRPIEVQATVKLPRFGQRSTIKAPYLPLQVIRQVVEIVGGLNEIDISEMTFDINVALPGSGQYSRILDFPLAMGLLSSYLQKNIPSRSLFVGELDLFRKVRRIDHPQSVEDLGRMLGNDLGPRPKVMYLNPETAIELKAVANDLAGIDLVEVERLDDAVKKIWPEILEG